MHAFYSHSLRMCIFILCAEAFYLRHNPAKIDTVPAIVRAYRERATSPTYVFASLFCCTRGTDSAYFALGKRNMNSVLSVCMFSCVNFLSLLHVQWYPQRVC